MQSRFTSQRQTPRVPPGLAPPGSRVTRAPRFPPGIVLSSGAATPRTSSFCSRNLSGDLHVGCDAGVVINYSLGLHHARLRPITVRKLCTRSRDVDIDLGIPPSLLQGAGKKALWRYMIILRDAYLLSERQSEEHKSRNEIVDSSLPESKTSIVDDIDRVTQYLSTMHTGSVDTYRRRQEMTASFSLEDDAEFCPNLLTTEEKEILEASYSVSVIEEKIKDDYPPIEAYHRLLL